MYTTDESALSIPSAGADHLRASLGLPKGAEVRLFYVPGPGDVVGTYEYFQAGRHDPRVPIMSYSGQLYEMCRHLQIRLHVATTVPTGISGDDLISFEEIDRPSWSDRKSYFQSVQTYAKAAEAAANKFNPHIVLVPTDYPQECWQALGNKRRFILTAHNTLWLMGQPAKGIKARVKRLRAKWRARALDGAICVSHECQRQVNEVTDGKIHSEVCFPQIAQPYEITPRDRASRLLYLGRIEENKGVFQLLDAFKTVSETVKELTLTFAGDGTAATELMARVDELGPTVRYVGQLSSAAAHETLDQTDLIICPTTRGFHEGLAVVGFEAAAHGVPSLLSDVVPAWEMLGEAAEVVKASDTDDLVRGLMRMVCDDVAFGARAKATASVRGILYDRSKSWSSGLYRVLTAA